MNERARALAPLVCARIRVRARSGDSLDRTEGENARVLIHESYICRK